MDKSAIADIYGDMRQFHGVAEKDDVAGLGGAKWNLLRPSVLVPGNPRYRHANFPMGVIDQAAAIESFLRVVTAVAVGRTDHAASKCSDIPSWRSNRGWTGLSGGCFGLGGWCGECGAVRLAGAAPQQCGGEKYP